MVDRIGSDVNRFKDIVRNKVKSNLSKYINTGSLTGQQGKKLVSIPIHTIDLPRFSFGDKNGGTGRGDGDEGDSVDGSQKGSGKGKAGEETGEHAFAMDFTPEELADMLGEELQLPKIEDKGKGKVRSDSKKYTGINNVGSEGLRNFRRTYKQALKRSLSTGEYNPHDPIIIPIKADSRYRTPKITEEPDCNTAVIYMMDVSGSMGDTQKHVVKSIVFWIDLWLKRQYKNIETRFIVHDSDAKEVNREEFFSIHEAGGTMISSAYKFCAEMMEKDYPFSDWNVYPFHFSDGDNWSQNDNSLACDVLKQKIIPNSNLFSYGQVFGGSGDFYEILQANFKEDGIAISKMLSSEDIVKTIKDFFKGGK